MSKFFRLSTLALAAGTMLAAGPAYAADNADMTVSAEVTAVCDVTVNNFTFTATPSNIATDWDHTEANAISITCTNGAGYSIGIDPGANQETLDTTDRRMANGTDYLPYKLYSDAHTTEVAADNAAGNYSATETGNGTAQSHSLAARVAQADVNAAKAQTTPTRLLSLRR